jgi:hypothetical protein
VEEDRSVAEEKCDNSKQDQLQYPELDHPDPKPKPLLRRNMKLLGPHPQKVVARYHVASQRRHLIPGFLFDGLDNPHLKNECRLIVPGNEDRKFSI